MSYIDVMIPASIGVLMLIAPGLFTRLSGKPEVDGPKVRYIRRLALLLLGVAALYLVIRMAERSW